MSAIAPSRPLPRFRLNLEEALRFFARDRRWPAKTAIGVLCTMLGFTIFGYLLAQGYLLTMAERVARAEPEPLPEWGDWGELLRKGAMVFLVNLVYNLPLILLAILFVVLLVAVILSIGGLQQLTGISGPTGVGAGLVALIVGLAVFVLLIMALGLFISLVLPAALAQLVLHDASPGAALRLREVFRFIRRHLGSYALAVLLYLGAGLLVSGLTSGLNFVGGDSLGVAAIAFVVAFGVGSVTGFFTQMFLLHMIGQLCWYERLSGAAGDVR